MHTDEHRVYRPVHDIARHPRRVVRRATSAGDAFYVELLGGREVWPTDRGHRRGSRWFLVGDTLIELRAAALVEADPVELPVDSPEALVERAWDAGYSVEVGDAAAAAVTLAIVDPTGRRIHLTRVGERRGGR